MIDEINFSLTIIDEIDIFVTMINEKNVSLTSEWKCADIARSDQPTNIFINYIGSRVGLKDELVTMTHFT